MEPENSLPHSLDPFTCPSPESDLSNTRPSSHILEIHFNIIPVYVYVFQVVSLP
jgi:hypothetical protein